MLHDPKRETRTILLRAIEILDERGWCQNFFEDEQGRVCTIGAVAHATRDISGQFDDDKTLEIVRVVSCHLGCVTYIWNDHPGRTVEEVKAALREAVNG